MYRTREAVLILAVLTVMAPPAMAALDKPITLKLRAATVRALPAQ